MTDTELSKLCADYVANGNFVHRVRKGYRGLNQDQRRTLSHDTREPITLYHNMHKNNPHTCKRWGDQ
jgi:hypothetical protein